MKRYMRFPNGCGKALTLSYDDGVEQDARLIHIMQRHGLKGTFNISSGCYAIHRGPNHRRMSLEQAFSLYTGTDMEIAAHGLSHSPLDRLPQGVRLYEVAKDRDNLENQFARIVRGFAYPYGTFCDETIEVLKQVGIVYARTVQNSQSFDLPRDWLQVNPTCHHNDPMLMSLAQQFVEQRVQGEPWLFYLWGHSYEFEAAGNWNIIEKFADYIGGRRDIWYATNIEVYNYVAAFQHLVYSLDGHRIYNPTAYTLYICQDDEIYSIEPTQSIEI